MSDDESFNERAADVVLETEQEYQENKADQHDLLDAVAEEDGAPLLETKCDIHGITVPVSGRLTGEFVERIERLDSEAKKRANGEGDNSGVSDIIRELALIIDETIDDPELTAEGVYATYQKEGVKPVRTILQEVIGALQREQERVEGTAEGFRPNTTGA